MIYFKKYFYFIEFDLKITLLQGLPQFLLLQQNTTTTLRNTKKKKKRNTLRFKNEELNSKLTFEKNLEKLNQKT